MHWPSKLGGVVILIVAGLLASFSLSWPIRDAHVCGLTVALSGRTLLGLVLILLAWTGADLVVKQCSQGSSGSSGFSLTHSILPTVLTGASWMVLGQLETTNAQVLGALGSGGLLVLIISSECHLITWTGWSRAAVRQFLLLMVYPVVMLAYLGIRRAAFTVCTSAAGVAGVSSLLALKLLGDDDPVLPQRFPGPEALAEAAARVVSHRWLRALAVGALVGLLACPLYHWAVSPLVCSSVLAVTLYVLVGVAGHLLSGTLTRRMALEYVVVGAVALALLLPRVR